MLSNDLTGNSVDVPGQPTGARGKTHCRKAVHRVDFLQFHGFLTGLMKFFEEFAKRLNSKCLELALQIDIDKVIIINDGVFDWVSEKFIFFQVKSELFIILLSYNGEP